MALPKNKKLPNRGGIGKHPGGGGKFNPPKGGLPPRSHNPPGKNHDVMPTHRGGKGKGNGPKGGKGGPKGGGKFYGGLGEYKGVNKRKVNNLINGIMRGELNDLRKQMRDVKMTSNNQRQGAITDYKRGNQDIEHIFGETGDFIQGLGQQTAGMYDQQATQAQAAQAALQQQLQGTYSGTMDQMQGEAERLGMGNMMGGGSAGMYADMANNQGVAAQTGANNMANIQSQGAGAANLNSLLQGMNQGSRMSAAGQNLNDRNDNLALIQQNRIDGMNQVREAMGDVRSSRRDLFMQMLNQLQETGWGQFLDNEQLKMQKRSMRKGRKR